MPRSSRLPGRKRPLLVGLVGGLAALTAALPGGAGTADPGAEPHPSPVPGSAAAADTLAGADWLSLLPEGEEKRRFVLDCTGCHPFDGGIARTQGRARTVAEWEAAVARMLGYAGAETSFPVISAGRDPGATARWLARHLAHAPAPRPAPALPEGAEVDEFLLPAPGDLPHDVAVDSRGRVVVTGMMTHRMYVLDPGTGRFDTVSIPVPKANPRAVEIDSLGNWWVVLGGPKSLARYSPSTQEWSVFEVGMYPHSLALAPDGHVWFNGHFSRAPELVGRVRAATGEVETFEVPAHPTLGAGPGGPIPYEIRVGPDGRIWGSELLGNRVFALDPSGGRFVVREMPLPASGPRRFDVDGSGALWIPAYTTNQLVRFDPRTGEFTGHDLPVPDAVPYVARVDPATGLVWVGTSAADAVFSFDPRTRAFTAYPLPSRGALVRHVAIDPRTREVWVAYGASPGIPARIARIRPPAPREAR
ncbi:MAG TPA: hypothetical protein VHG51_01280 [Longimicrobiaceae bacterium]|nr:hypothetical protein [Longimicrobiaceae bacterium]